MADDWQPRGRLSLKAVRWPLLALLALLVAGGLASPALFGAGRAAPAAQPGAPVAGSVHDHDRVTVAGETYTGNPNYQVPTVLLTQSVAPQAHYVPVDSLPAGWVNTPWGPLSPADRDVLNRVRQAGLWEGPSGTMAQSQAGSERTKQVGAILRSDHQALDEQTRALAAKLGVPVPDQPTLEQQGWLAEERAAQGAKFDQVFADRLRGAHGKIFSILAGERAGTRNDLMRGFTQVGINVVMKHMTLLESTNDVNYNALPTAPAPAASVVGPAQNAAIASAGTLSDGRNVIIWIVLGLALLAGVPAAVRVIRMR